MGGKNVTETIPADAAGIARAASMLRGGGVVAVPTETVYGLAARADSDAAVAAIYRAKGRPDFNPLIVHVGTLAEAEALGRFDARARRLAALFWPGPLTMVLPLTDDAHVAPAVTAGLPTIALRMPAHPAMQKLLHAAGMPLAAPSANRSEGISPTDAGHVRQSLGDAVPLVLDGGSASNGLESTIAALRMDGSWQLLRPGPVTETVLSEVLGPAKGRRTIRIEAPGQLPRHYSPGKPLRMDALNTEMDEFYIGYGAIAGHISLSESGDAVEAAARLYRCLHEAAAAKQPRIAVAPVPAGGIGAAINDRLRRAAF